MENVLNKSLDQQVFWIQLLKLKKTEGQIDDLISEIKTRMEKNERVLVTTLTIRMAEELTSYLKV